MDTLLRIKWDYLSNISTFYGNAGICVPKIVKAHLNAVSAAMKIRFQCANRALYRTGDECVSWPSSARGRSGVVSDTCSF